MQTGERLPNGAVVLLEQNGVVLARGERGMPGLTGGVEFITWRWDGKDPKSTYWGHYFNSIGEAARDFEARVAKEGYRAA